MEFDVKSKILTRINDKISQLERLKATITIDTKITSAVLDRYQKMLNNILK
jgi:hypothetical protein